MNNAACCMTRLKERFIQLNLFGGTGRVAQIAALHGIDVIRETVQQWESETNVFTNGDYNFEEVRLRNIIPKVRIG